MEGIELYKNSWITFVLIFSAAYMIILGIVIRVKSQGGAIVRWFLCIVFVMWLWTTFYIFERLAPSVEIKWLISCVEYIAICYLGFFAYMFSRSYRGLKSPSKLKLAALLSPPTFFYISVLTNPLHHQFYRSFTIQTEIYGPLCWALIYTTLLYYLGGVYHFIRKSKYRSIYRKRQMLYFSAAIIVPITIHILNTIKLIDLDFNISLVVMPYSLFLITISVLKYKFLDILPHALLDVVEFIDDGFMVINVDNDLEDYNALFFNRFIDLNHCEKMEDVIDVFAKIVDDSEDLDNLILALKVGKNDYISGEIAFKKKQSDTYLNIQYTTKAINDLYGSKIATIITFHDITEIQNLYLALENKKEELMEAKKRLEDHIASIQQLTIEKERNKLMSEVHDTLGHSMTEVLALLEKCDLILDQKDNQLQFEAVLEETIERARKGLAEIRSAVTRFKKMGVEI
ncbi:histidine kinase N-terminal 7TM domain-containing protein [Petrocella sp. FN5]|uniref:histidine kinase N-terminal 7TM domain-containing protein n=1 Tax=Petrocella sp. FN5 TaxID=3032002 RepID=UPI0023DA1B04|nr:histidine kinase N-terminal 7TM domain-containing protein [Petrocella sp. FN5]MDF1617100.1 histidine kinase N-terminal 7TM domain-containing protein [Petrocella sp. FN5]